MFTVAAWVWLILRLNYNNKYPITYENSVHWKVIKMSFIGKCIEANDKFKENWIIQSWMIINIMHKRRWVCTMPGKKFGSQLYRVTWFAIFLIKVWTHFITSISLYFFFYCDDIHMRHIIMRKMYLYCKWNLQNKTSFISR